jgi:site-specific DNA-methyltransferase (adenine-specific)
MIHQSNNSWYYVEIMQDIPNNSIDITFADPPFNFKKKYNGYKDNKEINGYLEY